MKGTEPLYFADQHVVTAKARPGIIVTLAHSKGTGEYVLEYGAAKALWADLGHAMRKVGKEAETLAEMAKEAR